MGPLRTPLAPVVWLRVEGTIEGNGFRGWVEGQKATTIRCWAPAWLFQRPVQESGATLTRQCLSTFAFSLLPASPKAMLTGSSMLENTGSTTITMTSGFYE